jgi:hypothetical protein
MIEPGISQIKIRKFLLCPTRNTPLTTYQKTICSINHFKLWVMKCLYSYTPDYSSKAAYVNGTLADEGAATMKNIEVQREIKANGGPNIEIAGNPANRCVQCRL